MGHPGDSNAAKLEVNARSARTSNRLPPAVNAYHANVHPPLEFSSRKHIFDGIMESFRHDRITSIGLCGIGGSGKTTLVKQLVASVKQLNMFSHVVFVNAGRKSGVKRIQAAIAKELGLMMGEDDPKLTGFLCQRLIQYPPVLLILDDLREVVQPHEIGILKDPNQPGGCKLLITSRTVDVASACKIDVIFSLYLLTDWDSYRLLWRCEGLGGFDYPTTDLAMKVAGLNGYPKLGMEVTKKCRGLPILISVVGSALTGKNIEHWNRVWTILNDSAIVTDLAFDVKILKWIIDFSTIGALKIKVAARTLFSICGLFPPGQEIFVEDLCLYAAQLDLCSKNEAIAVINSLKKSSLLMQADGSSERVIMHDVLHDMAVMLVKLEKPEYKDSVEEYMSGPYYDEDHRWKDELDILVIQLYGAPDNNPSSSSFSFSGDSAPSNSYIASSGAATLPKPSGKMVNFKEGRCPVDKSFLRLLKEACRDNPQLLVESQRMHSEILRQRAFDNLGTLLFLLSNVSSKDWVHHKQELQMFWEQTHAMKFDLDWLRPKIEGIFSSPEFARIEGLREKERYWNREAAQLRERLKDVENKAAQNRTEIEREECMLNSLRN